MKLLLDTTVLIDALRAKTGQQVLLDKLLLAKHDLTIAAVTVAEVYAGIRSGEEAKVASVLRHLPCEALTAVVAKRAGLLKNTEARNGRTMSVADAMVAATALEYGYLLVTANRKDFAPSGIPLFPEELGS